MQRKIPPDLLLITLKRKAMYSPFEYINKRPLKVRRGKQNLWIKTNGQRVNLTSTNDHSSTDTGRTYYFSEDKQKVKQIENYV